MFQGHDVAKLNTKLAGISSASAHHFLSGIGPSAFLEAPKKRLSLPPSSTASEQLMEVEPTFVESTMEVEVEVVGGPSLPDPEPPTFEFTTQDQEMEVEALPSPLSEFPPDDEIEACLLAMEMESSLLPSVDPGVALETPILQCEPLEPLPDFSLAIECAVEGDMLKWNGVCHTIFFFLGS